MTKYTLIANDIRNQIANGILKANEQLPFEKDICCKYAASKMTVKKALDILVSEGLIVKRRGSGTFVKSISDTDLSKLVITNQFRGLTALYSNHKVTSKLLKFEVVAGSETVCNKLILSKDEFVYKLVRVRYVDGTPYVIENTYMPINLIVGLKKQRAEQSIYSYIEETLKLKIQSTHRIISVRKSDSFEQEHLRLNENDPVAVAEQVSYLENGTAFEYSTCIHSYKHFSFETVIIR